MSHILIVGRKFGPLTEKLEANGHTYLLLQDRAATKFPDKRFKNRVVADFTSKETILRAVDSLGQSFDGVMKVYENYVLPASWIAEHLSVPALPQSAAEACTDKFLMRSLFAKAPEKISPAFANVASEQDVIDFASAHEFPIILKPANLVKSLLVTKSETMDELVKNYRHSVELLESTYKQFAPNRTPQLIIEEFLHGSIHSVDAFVDSEGTPHVLEQVVDYQTGYDIGHEDNFHYSRILPSTLSPSDQAALRHCAEVGIRALGIKNSPAHVEIIMTPHGPRIVEIGARSGGYRERMHALANDIDITGLAVETALGRKPDITATKNDPCAVLELFPKTPGVFDGIENLEQLEKLRSLTYLKVRATDEKYIGKAADGYKMAAIIILHHSDKAVFDEDLRFINEHVFVKTH